MDRGQSYGPRSTAAGVVELTATLRMFYTLTSGLPDTLFTVLLASAREAYAITGGSNQHAELADRSAGLIAETYLAGSLLCDANFVPARVSPDCGHHYILNLVKGEIQLRTEVYAAAAGRTCLFGVTLKGSIRGSEFALLNTSTQILLANVREEDVKKPSFFRDTLPRLASRLFAPPGMIGPDTSQGLIDHAIELEVAIPLQDRTCKFVIRKAPCADQGVVYAAETGSSVGRLGLGCLGRLMRAGLRRMKLSEPDNADENVTCFLDLLPVIMRGDKVPLR